MTHPTNRSFFPKLNWINFPFTAPCFFETNLSRKIAGIAKAVFSNLIGWRDATGIRPAKKNDPEIGTAKKTLLANKKNNGGIYAKLFEEVKKIGEENDQNALQKIQQDRIEKLVRLKIDELKNKKIAFPADFRMELFKHTLKTNPKTPETESSKLIRMMFDFDAEYIQNSLKNWKTKTEEAQIAIKKVQEFLAKQTLPEEMSFQQHAHLCYCLAALMSGTEIKDLDKVYDTQLHTMVRGVVHPERKWTPKTLLEDQRYAKFIFHVSKTGLTSIPQINNSIFRLNESADSPFISVHFGAVACNESPEFDGVKDCGARRALEHDFIHDGFALYAYEENPEKYWDRLQKIGMMAEHISNDPELVEGSRLWQQVHAAFFMWHHELTTSVFVAGWPRGLPEKH